MCVQSLMRRKGRTFLTVLGVFIGCTSIIVMVSIGIGMTESINQSIENMGDLTVIEVYSGQTTDGKQTKLDDDAVTSFKEIAGVQSVMPKYQNYEYSFECYAGANNRYKVSYVDLYGIDTEAMEDMGYEFTEGVAAANGKDEAVAGRYFAYQFEDTLLPEGSNMIDYYSALYDENYNQIKDPDLPDPYVNFDTTPITIRVVDSADNTKYYDRELKVTGTVAEDYAKGYETSSGLLVSINTLKDIISTFTGTPAGKTEYTSINVKATDIDTVTEVESQIKALGYNTSSMQSYREEMQKSARQTQMMLGGIGAISLFVAAIGIMNTMIMSISERTKEIGIMKSLGCYVRDIRAMFLMESGMIGLMGGIVGIVFSYIVSDIINVVSFGTGFTKEAIIQGLIGGEGISRISVIPLWLVVFAILFAIAVGLVSGYYPSNKAVKIPALEAIKTE